MLEVYFLFTPLSLSPPNCYLHESVPFIRSTQRGLPLLLIALTGSVGTGKASLLLDLSAWFRRQAREVDGFVAVGRERAERGRGAGAYDLRMLADDGLLPFARRDESRIPPYSISGNTVGLLQDWARGLKNHPHVPLIILDEFGPLEAGGGGHMALWPQVRASQPEVVIVAVRKGMQQPLENVMGSRFDVVIDGEAEGAFDKVRQACLEHADWTRVGVYGAGAGGFEATVGALLHGTQVPLRGLFLSSTQSAIMTYAADGLGDRSRVVWVPLIAACLKALSPAGNRLRPMLAITVQGLLYGGAITAAGWNPAGVVIGGFLIGAWSATQGIALQYLFVGSDLIRGYDAIILWVAQHFSLGVPGLVTLFGIWAGLCGGIAAVVTLLAWYRRHRIPARLQTLLDRGSRAMDVEDRGVGWRPALRHGLQDMTRTFFWLPVIIVSLIVFATGSSLESVVWILLRAIVLGFVLFALARAFDPRRFIAWLRGRGHWGPALAFQQAMRPHRDPGTPFPGPENHGNRRGGE